MHSNDPGFANLQGELQEVWDSTDPLPALEDAKQPFVTYCERHHLTPGDLKRVGARIKKDGTTLAFFWENGVRFLDLIASRPWAWTGSTWEPMKVLPGTSSNGSVVVVEGESDAARLSGPDGPGMDVAVMGGGATNVYTSYIDTLRDYDTVYLALDDDAAGDLGAHKIAQELGGNAVRWRPPEDGDWCDAEAIPRPPVPPQELPLLVWGDALHDIDYPELPSLLENAMLPDNGMLFIHGWKGAYKSWLAFDLAVALATGTDWGPFATTLPEVKTAVVQFELPSTYYIQRMEGLRDALPQHARDKYRNVATYRPLEKVRLDISNEKTQEHFLTLFTENKVRCAIFDPIRVMSGARSHYEQEWQSAVVDFSRKLNQQGIAIVLTHHDGKTASRTGGGSMLDASAADAIVGATDASVSIALPKGETWETSKKRNLVFYTRNAETPPMRGFAIEGENIVWHDEPFYAPDDEEADDAPAI